MEMEREREREREEGIGDVGEEEEDHGVKWKDEGETAAACLGGKWGRRLGGWMQIWSELISWIWSTWMEGMII